MMAQPFKIDCGTDDYIVGTLYDVPHAKGTAIIQHGLSGYKEEHHIQIMADCCVDAGWRTIIFDCRHAYGDSSGDLIHACVSSYVADLTHVINHYVGQEETLILLGHSLGSGSILKYTYQNPQRVFAVAPTATIIAHDLYVENHMARDAASFQTWQDTGRYLKQSTGRPHKRGYVSFAMVDDLKDLRIVESLDQLTMPAFFMVGDQDVSTPPEQQKYLFDAWRGAKEYHVIPDCGHTFRSPDSLALLRSRLGAWLAGLTP